MPVWPSGPRREADGHGRVNASVNPARRISLADFERIFESVKNWGRWGSDDERGTLNYIQPGHIVAAAALVRSGRQVSMAIPINMTAGPDNPNPAVHLMIQGHDIDPGMSGPRYALDYLAMASHGDCHTHVDALCHVSYDGRTYNGHLATEVVDSRGPKRQDVTSYATGLVGRGVLLDIPRFRGVEWLEPGDAVDRAELEACEAAEGVRLGEGDVLVFRTGHHRRRLALGPWNNDYPPSGEGKAGLHVDTIPWMHERRISAFLPDGDGETVPGTVEGLLDPIHPLQIAAMGMLAADSLQLEELAAACEEEGRFEFLVVGLPLRLPGGTGSPWNPIAIF
jgi:kynurenine formamidase